MGDGSGVNFFTLFGLRVFIELAGNDEAVVAALRVVGHLGLDEHAVGIDDGLRQGVQLVGGEGVATLAILCLGGCRQGCLQGLPGFGRVIGVARARCEGGQHGLIARANTNKVLASLVEVVGGGVEELVGGAEVELVDGDDARRVVLDDHACVVVHRMGDELDVRLGSIGRAGHGVEVLPVCVLDDKVEVTSSFVLDVKILVVHHVPAAREDVIPSPATGGGDGVALGVCGIIDFR